MQRKKKTHPRRQARGCATKSTTSLSQREWERKWDEVTPAVIAMTLFFFAFLVLGEAGVL